MKKIQPIHNSLINRQGRQMVEQINEYGLYDFWHDYKEYLIMRYVDGDKAIRDYFPEAVIRYHRITTR